MAVGEGIVSHSFRSISFCCCFFHFDWILCRRNITGNPNILSLNKSVQKLTCEVWLTTDCWWWLLVMWLCCLRFHSRSQSLSLSRSLSRCPVSSSLIGLSSSVVSSVIDDKRFSFSLVANFIAYCKMERKRKKERKREKKNPIRSWVEI